MSGWDPETLIVCGSGFEIWDPRDALCSTVTHAREFGVRRLQPCDKPARHNTADVTLMKQKRKMRSSADVVCSNWHGQPFLIAVIQRIVPFRRPTGSQKRFLRNAASICLAIIWYCSFNYYERKKTLRIPVCWSPWRISKKCCTFQRKLLISGGKTYVVFCNLIHPPVAESKGLLNVHVLITHFLIPRINRLSTQAIGDERQVITFEARWHPRSLAKKGNGFSRNL